MKQKIILQITMFLIVLLIIQKSINSTYTSTDTNLNLNLDLSNQNFLKNLQYYEQTRLSNVQLAKIPQNRPTDDETSQRIHAHILKLAVKLQQKSNIGQKKILNGILPDSYSEEMKRKASQIHNNKKKWENIMANPTEIWGFCVYPKYKLNSMTWCEQIYNIKDHSKVNDCKNSFCSVCCDQLPFLLKSIADGNKKIGKNLMLNKLNGFSRVNKIVQPNEIDKCRKECKRVYPVKLPIVYPAPPRDSQLGKSQENSARSCADIKKWGDQNSKSGEYWIDLGLKGKVIAYCDMETDKGGWTLFFNYVHKPSQEIFINGSKLPKNLKENSHINLRDVGIEENFIQEIRFYCTEQSKYKYYMHFKIKSKEIIRAAFSGDQSKLTPNDFMMNFNDLPLGISPRSWIRVFDKNNIDDIDYVGGNSNGSFWNTPFGSMRKKKFWTVKAGRFECGTYHKDSLDNSEANLVSSNHSVWFRGPPPNDEVARMRYTSRNFSK